MTAFTRLFRCVYGGPDAPRPEDVSGDDLMSAAADYIESLERWQRAHLAPPHEGSRG